ncbi:MAG: hypothetical protein ACPGSF_05330, partial [Flavobacteriaceae bacterium]
SEAFAASQERMSKRVDTLKDSIAQLVVEQTDNAYFSLGVNRDAQQAHPDFSPEELQIIIENYILLSNDNPKGNPLLSSLGSDWIVNKIHVVNHQWILADFTNGTQWGDALFLYQVKANSKPRLRLLNHVMYP